MAIHELLREWPFRFFRHIIQCTEYGGKLFRSMTSRWQSVERPVMRPSAQKPAYAMHVMRRVGARNALRQINLKQFVSMPPER